MKETRLKKRVHLRHQKKRPGARALFGDVVDYVTVDHLSIINPSVLGHSRLHLIRRKLALNRCCIKCCRYSTDHSLQEPKISETFTEIPMSYRERSRGGDELMS
ncbi:unnamed protein product [Pleuronectes platessa]|uniref:Uncharacterized protein n=1 Tax=Pleuronectes platessa TaxID=8262 RepID=A0A9N7YDA2_PLEPL|nr:unnamed protein product [Pleuronectes platessa]